MANTGVVMNDSKSFVQERRGRGTQLLSSFNHSPDGIGRPSFLSSMASSLGLHPGASCHVSYYLLANFVLNHVVLAPRHLMQHYKIDDNTSPRQAIDTHGERAVKEGKITRAQFNMIKRNQSAQLNRHEGFDMFAASAILAVVAGVPNHVVNADCLIYTLASISYGAAYILITDLKLSLLRTASWYATVGACIHLLYRAGKNLNSK